MIGRGSNLLIPDHGFGGLVIRLKGDFWRTIDLRTDDTIIVGAGAKLKEICKFACLKNLKGFEFWKESRDPGGCIENECRCHGLGNI